MQGEIWSYRDRQTLLDLREKHGVSILQLADKSGVAPSVVYCMLLGRPVSRSQAFQVIKGLGDLTGVSYTLRNVDVPVIDDEV